MASAGKPIAAITLGRTRADDLLTLKVTDRCTNALRAVALQERPSEARAGVRQAP